MSDATMVTIGLALSVVGYGSYRLLNRPEEEQPVSCGIDEYGPYVRMSDGSKRRPDKK